MIAEIKIQNPKIIKIIEEFPEKVIFLKNENGNFITAENEIEKIDADIDTFKSWYYNGKSIETYR